MASMSMDELIALHVAGLGPTTRKAHRSHLADWVRWCNENMIDPWKVGPEHIELYGRWLRETMGYSIDTQYSGMGIVSRLYTDAYHRGLIDRDPAPFVRRPRRRSHSEGTWLDRDQARTLLDAAENDPDPRLGALVCLLLLNGLRISEVLSLDVEDYKPGDPPILHLHRKGGWEQNVAISTRTTRALDRLIDGRRSGPVLLDKEGNRLTHRRMMVLFDELTAPLGLNRITPHGLRRTFATLSREAGVPDEDIMAAGGWAHKQMLDYYDMIHHALKGEATNILTDYLG